MDIIIRNVPPQSRDDHLETFLRPLLEQFGITAFYCQSPKNKPFAFLTVLDVLAGNQLVLKYGGSGKFGTANKASIRYHNRPLSFDRSNNAPDQFTLQGLRNILARQTKTSTKSTSAKAGNARASRTHMIQSVSCGAWEYRKGRAVFIPAYADGRAGTLVLGRRGLILVLDTRITSPDTHQMHVSYSTMDSVTLTTHPPSLSFNISESPRFYRLTTAESSLADKLQSLNLNSVSTRDQKLTKERALGLHPAHNAISGMCFAYRVQLDEKALLNDIRNILKALREAPDPISVPTEARSEGNSFHSNLSKYHKLLSNPKTCGELGFGPRFQMHKMTTNGILSPGLAEEFLQRVLALHHQYDHIALAEGLRAMTLETPFAGPQTDAAALSVTSLVASLVRSTKAFTKAGSNYDLAEGNAHMALIHRVTVTPTGLYLDGPELETKNRVLRKYTNHLDYFLRVTFADEDFGRVQYEPGVNRDEVFKRRFKHVIDGPISIADRAFSFLGFSHSSLRASQVWFMAPFVMDQGLVHAEKVRKDLGNFTAIRSPAKCAARIGQAFSDATDTVPLPRSVALMGEPDVERNNYTFSDGVGMISKALLRRIWREFSKTRKSHATLLQVRYQGAKGMLVLDTTLKGELAVFRRSMIKFEDSNDLNLEICGAGYKRLPMYLNRQFIKILEDLGVPDETFLDLQKHAVQQIAVMTNSAINAANFLEDNKFGQAVGLPGFLRMLSDLGLDYSLNDFLRLCVEIAAMTHLRQIKYRARIPVPDAHTLYGTMDETGTLEPGQVFVCVRRLDGSVDVLTGAAVVTRAPALHPGDMQIVHAVTVPEHSPLKALHNCVVFSQKGERDLPSQLSGGDLDGDLYNVIFDSNLWPAQVYQAAEYPRLAPVDIGRTVESQDMTNFFLTFMETDQLGYISNTHLQIADQKESGTFDPLCLELASMASTAVDYSKTGIPVDMSKFPGPRQYSRNAKPDFMAIAPRLVLNDNEKLHLEDIEEAEIEQDTDAVSTLEPDRKRTLFYESEKVLGKLYRAIDETKFLKDMKAQQDLRLGNARSLSSIDTLMDRLWAFIQRETRLLQWAHQRSLAREIKEVYEDKLVDVAHSYKIDHSYPLSEVEVFTGIILGRKGGVPDKRTREINVSMREQFDRDMRFIVEWILYGDGERGSHLDADDLFSTCGEDSDEALERSIACFAVAMEEKGKVFRQFGELKSFKIVAASVCLRTLRQTMGGLRGLA
ncbi:MAG: hypothetical protein M1828_003932 [Chrysothrix sp. TS-e1954]|nr:MAG: hypothetical protein M1828_003932 [Chrysothrix sp. TS-e1954]